MLIFYFISRVLKKGEKPLEFSGKANTGQLIYFDGNTLIITYINRDGLTTAN